MFCKGCGASLAARTETSPVPPQSISAVCEKCGANILVGEDCSRCQKAGAPIQQQVSQGSVSAPVSDASTALPEPETTLPSRTPSPAASLGPARKAGIGIAALLLIGGIVWWFSGARIREYQGALSAGRLIGNDGASAIELYSEEVRASGPTSNRTQQMRNLARSVLRDRLDDLFTRWYQDSDLGEGGRWADVQRLAVWYTEIEPSDSRAQLRAKFSQAQTEILSNHFVEAEQLFRSALVHEPNSSLVLNGIARACRNQRNYQCAEDYYKRAAQADPGWIFPHQNLAGLYLEQNRLVESEGEYQSAVRIDPNRSGSRFLLGQLYDRRRSFSEACSEYRAALSLASNQARVSFDREWVNQRIPKVCN